MSESLTRLEKKVNLNLIKPQNSLKKAQLLNDLLVVLKQKIADYPASHNLKICNEFLLMCCKLVEEVIKKADLINKKQLVLDLFKSMFNLSLPELVVLDNAVEFLWSNGLICKIPVVKKCKKWIQKKAACIL